MEENIGNKEIGTVRKINNKYNVWSNTIGYININNI